jgi:hypothetical protein
MCPEQARPRFRANLHQTRENLWICPGQLHHPLRLRRWRHLSATTTMIPITTFRLHLASHQSHRSPCPHLLRT